jgi:hypothetical protein
MIRIRRFQNSLMLVDATHMGAQVHGRVPAVNPQTRHERAGRSLRMTACRLLASASVCFATAGATAAETTTVPSPICTAADLRLVTLIEAHGEAQDVAPEVLAQAFFTVLEARKACNQGQVEAAMELYRSIPLRSVISSTD